MAKPKRASATAPGRRQAQDALAKERTFLSEVLETAGALVVVLDTEGRIESFNRMCEQVTGYSFEEVKGRRLWDLFLSPKEKEPVRRIFKQLRVAQFPSWHENRWLTRDGGRRLISWSNTAILDEEGLVKHVVAVGIDITDSKEAEQRLARSEERYRTMIEYSNDVIWMLDSTGSFTYFNDRAEQLSGYALEEWIGKSWAPLVPREDLPRLRDVLVATMAGEPQHYEADILAKDGSAIALSVNTAPIYESGKAVGTVSFGRDITEAKRARAALRDALRQSEKKTAETAALLEGTSAVLKHEHFSDAAAAIFDVCKKLVGAAAGYIALLTKDGRENEVVFLDPGGMPCGVDPMMPMPIRGLRAKAYRAGETVYENRFATSRWTKYLPKGHVRLESAMFAPLIVEGRVAGLLGLANKPGGFTDEDARTASAFADNAAVALYNSRLLESLKSSEERFRSVAESATDAIISVDSRGRVVLWNTAAENVFGYAREEVVGKPLAAIMPQRFREAHRSGMQRVVSSGKSRIIGKTMELAAVRKDGTEFPIELSLAKWQTSEGIFFTGIIRDISQRKQAELLGEALDKINATVLSTLDPDEILQRIVVEAGKAIGAETCRISMREGDHWVVRYLHGASKDLLGVRLTDDEFPLSALAARTKKPVVSNDVYNDDQADRKTARKHGIRSALIAPLFAKGEAMGTLAFTYHSAPVGFSQAQVDFAGKLATSVSLAVENARLYQQEHRIAQILQEGLIQEVPEIRGLDIGIVYGSAYEAERVGGDFYDIFEVGDGLVAVLVGDVSGKGVRAAGLTETIRSSVRTLAYIDPSPAFVFSRLNQSLIRQLPAGDFATAVLLVLDVASGDVAIASAGHPPPVLCGNRCAFADVAPGALLGAFSTTYKESYLNLSEAQDIILYTDGLIEARKDSELFGQGRLLKVMQWAHSLDIQETVDDLLRAATEFAQGKLADDIAIVGLRIKRP